MIDAQYSNNYVSNLRENGLNLATTTVNGTGKRNILDFSSAGIFIKDTDGDIAEEHMNNIIGKKWLIKADSQTSSKILERN